MFLTNQGTPRKNPFFAVMKSTKTPKNWPYNNPIGMPTRDSRIFVMQFYIRFPRDFFWIRISWKISEPCPKLIFYQSVKICQVSIFWGNAQILLTILDEPLFEVVVLLLGLDAGEADRSPKTVAELHRAKPV